ncbi:MAG: CRTAC1 family protein [Lentisphaeria bacterium]|nr:CRTAC1 family protein [Lentisphaeria bacterium]
MKRAFQATGLALLTILGASCATRQPRQTKLVIPAFEDITTASGLAGTSARYVNWLDADGDGDADLLINGTRLFRNDSDTAILFVDITASCGLKGAQAGAVLCLDLDNDGDTDIVSTRGQVWENSGNAQFSDRATEFGFAPHAKSNVMGAGDVDGDGFVDLFVGMKEDWNDGKPTYYPAELWRNRAGRKLDEVGKVAGIRKKTYARGVVFHDFDADGHQDIFVANYRLQANLLWRNKGDGTFEEIAKTFGGAGRFEKDKYHDAKSGKRFGPNWGHTIGACLLDFDNDGRQDLFTANLVHKYVGPSKAGWHDIRGYVCDDSAIYRSTKKGLEDWRDQLGVVRRPIGPRGVFTGDELWAGCIAGDANNDGWQDVFIPQVYNLPYAQALLLLNQRGHAFADCAKDAGIQRIDTYAGAWADVDNDGWLDLVTAGRPAKGKPAGLILLRNITQCPDQRTWIKVRLASTPQNTAIGATVRVTAGAAHSEQVFVVGSSTYGQQNDPTLHFGLEQPARKATVRVTWPNGTITTTRANTGHTVTLQPEK